MPSEKELRGRLLKTQQLMDGTSRATLDNGPFRTVTIHCLTEQLQDLLAADPRALYEHLISRKPGHFRRK